MQLLKLRLASGNDVGAIALLEPLSDQNPTKWSLRLLLADLRLQQTTRQVLSGRSAKC